MSWIVRELLEQCFKERSIPKIGRKLSKNSLTYKTNFIFYNNREVFHFKAKAYDVKLSELIRFLIWYLNRLPKKFKFGNIKSVKLEKLKLVSKIKSRKGKIKHYQKWKLFQYEEYHQLNSKACLTLMCRGLGIKLQMLDVYINSL